MSDLLSLDIHDRNEKVNVITIIIIVHRDSAKARKHVKYYNKDCIIFFESVMCHFNGKEMTNIACCSENYLCNDLTFIEYDNKVPK